VQAPGLVTESAVAWLRVVQTFSLVWLLPYGIRRVKDAEYVLGVVEFAAAAEIIRAVFDAVTSGGIGDRLTGGNSPNTEGLLAALLVVAVLHAPVPRRTGIRVTYLVIGLLGLFMSRSLGATAAVAAALAIFGIGRHAAARLPTSGSLMPVRVILFGRRTCRRRAASTAVRPCTVRCWRRPGSSCSPAIRSLGSAGSALRC
jgi:hypothetical protein